LPALGGLATGKGGAKGGEQLMATKKKAAKKKTAKKK